MLDSGVCIRLSGAMCPSRLRGVSENFGWVLCVLLMMGASSLQAGIVVDTDFPGGSGVVTETIENGQTILHLDPTVALRPQRAPPRAAEHGRRQACG